ncbi:MAG: helix-turn-helix transcriptional regulator [Lachnospiraceae bacterium]|nr:helix-turn-helix transcriptional regulator [Lachnospiraceae bacterium]
MMENEKLKKLSLQLVSHHTNPFDNLRENLLIYVAQPNITLKNLSDASSVSIDTLKSLLYGKVTDCKISTAEKLACALGITVSELIGSRSVDSITLKNIANCRQLPEHQLYLVRWFINRQMELAMENKHKGKKIISVIKPSLRNNSLKMTNMMEPLCIDHLPETVKANVFLGLKITCDHYMPYFSPYDILLIAADREGLNNELCVVIYYDSIFIARKHIYMEEGVSRTEYLGLLDPTFRVSEQDVDSKIGYVVDVYHP